MHVLQTTTLLKKCSLLILLCLIVLTYYVEYNYRYAQLSQWSGGNAPDCDARGPGFNSRLWLIFVCLFLLLCFYFFDHKHYLHETLPFEMLIYLVYFPSQVNVEDAD